MVCKKSIQESCGSSTLDCQHFAVMPKLSVSMQAYNVTQPSVSVEADWDECAGRKGCCRRLK